MNIEETKELTLNTVNSLPEKQRILFKLYYYDNLTIAEIADFIDMTEAEVKNDLNLGRIEVNARLARYEECKGIDLISDMPFPLLFMSMDDMVASQLRK